MVSLYKALLLALAFEVASIKPSDPAQPIAFKRSGYHIATTATSLDWLIAWSYDLHSSLIYGKPGWLDSVRYDIVANAAPDYVPAPRRPGEIPPLQRMMQQLLHDRFHLAVHTETRELPMYALTVAPGGPRFRVTQLHGEIGQNPFDMPGRGRLTGTQVTAEMLAKVLSNQAGRSVQDLTGLQGVFDFKLEWEPDPQPPNPDDASPAAPVRNRSSLFTALQEQLGLKLEARKGPIQVLVIDRIDRTPTEN